ncbi:hypothetical protein QBC44DRAFT_312686 [Cladorrhinum sp. PSN332]|nr:hypothetical protein QBC44DRAFT_312686 [Cladorrhinum sp. PSN332]
MLLSTAPLLAVLAILAGFVSAQTPTRNLNHEECTSAYYSLYAHAPPTAPPALASWAEKARSTISETWTTTYSRDDPGLVVTAFCSDLVALPKPTPPDSVSAAWNSYSSALSKWRESLAPAASSIATACVEAESYVAENVLLMIATDYEGCTSALNIGKRDLAPSADTTSNSVAAVTTAPGGVAKQNDNQLSATPSNATSTGGGVAWAKETRGCVAAAVAAVAVGVVAVMGEF